MTDPTATSAAIHRRPTINGDEHDAFSPAARRALAVFTRPGVAHKTKTRYARRTRRADRQALRAMAA